MKTTEEMIAVMHAYANGKTIQVRRCGSPNWFDCEPVWNWFASDYRIKPEPTKKKIVPYESAEEFLAAQKEHGPYIDIPKRSYRIPDVICDLEIWIGACRIPYYTLLSDYKWQDGCVCGKEVEE